MIHIQYRAKTWCACVSYCTYMYTYYLLTSNLCYIIACVIWNIFHRLYPSEIKRILGISSKFLNFSTEILQQFGIKQISLKNCSHWTYYRFYNNILNLFIERNELLKKKKKYNENKYSTMNEILDGASENTLTVKIFSF